MQAASDTARLAAALTSGCGWRAESVLPLTETLVAAAELHGIAQMLYAAGKPPTGAAVTGRSNGGPAQARLTDLVMAGVASAQVRQRTLREISSQFAASGIACLVLKGTALAHTVYATPWVRPGADIDLLVHEDDRARAMALLNDSGWQPDLASDGPLISAQRTLRRAQHALSLPLDLHWRVSNHWSIATALSFERLWEERHPLGSVAPEAYWPGPLNALLHACAHRAVHFHAPYQLATASRLGDRLVWLEDIRRLVEILTAERWARLPSQAANVGLLQITKSALNAAFSDDAGRLRQLARWPEPKPEVSARLLNRSALAPLRADLAALGGVRLRLALLMQHLFPSATYMRRRYGGTRHPLVWLYVARLMRGAWRKLWHQA